MYSTIHTYMQHKMDQSIPFAERLVDRLREMPDVSPQMWSLIKRGEFGYQGFQGFARVR